MEPMEVEDDSGNGPVLHSIEVNRPLQVDIDVGTLLVSDTNEVNVRSLRSNPAAYLKSLARDNMQLLANEVWKLPFERVDDVIITKLPKPKYIIPREKPAPKPRALTKWESYAKEKGITKRKKTKLVWDELVKKWVPRFGYKKAEVEHEKDWVLEVPGNADPMEDQFEKKSEIKAEKVSKNELQRLRNLAKAKKISVPKAGITSKERPTKNELTQAVQVAKTATASLGKFQKKLPKEKPAKGTGKKRKFDPLVLESGIEKTKNLDVLARVMSKKPKMDLEKVVNLRVRSEEPGKTSFRNKSQGPKSGGSRASRRTEGKRRSSGPSKNDNKRSVAYGGRAQGQGGRGRGGGGRGGGAGRGRGGGGGRGRGGSSFGK